MLKRIVLFCITNLLILVTISIVLNVLGVKPYLTAQGIDYQALMAFCLVWGMGGAFISLALSRVMAKWMLGVKVISRENAGELQWVVNMVDQIAKSAGLPKTPEIGIYESPEINAFATGPTKSRALVAFSTGLLRSMKRDEVEGVAAHEVAHIANGDMVTVTLLQGVVNAVVMFLARVIAFAASQTVKEENRSMVHFVVVLVLDILLGILGMMVVMWFSRHREFRADAGAGRYVGNGKMIAALRSLQRGMPTLAYSQAESMNSLKISGQPSRFSLLFSSHPSLDLRIARLEGRGA
jgi:heat shock protein HtpX